MPTEPEEYVTEDRAIRRDFYKNVFDVRVDNKNPSEVLDELCDLWLKASNASWVWLWLFNPHSHRAELYAKASVDKEANAPTHSSSDGGHENKPFEYSGSELPGAVQLSMDSGKAYSIDDLEGWNQEYSGQVYRVPRECVLYLQERFSDVYDSVPVMDSPELRRDPSVVTIKGAITLHYHGNESRVNNSMESLELMGHITASKIRDAYEAERFRLLVKLNSLASKHLTKANGKTSDERIDYLRGLKDLINETVKTNYVSVFYRRPFVDEVDCLFTTGLIEMATGRIVRNDDLSNVSYKLNQHYTGICFATGEPRFVPESQHTFSNHSPKFSEVGKDDKKSVRPCLLAPIPRSSEKSPRVNGPNSDGVIRIVGRRGDGNGSNRNFDPLDAETMFFIAQQVSPVLDMLASSVNRERQVGIIKHDLEAPLIMITDTVDQVEHEVAELLDPESSREQLSSYCLPDLKMSALVARNLVQDLDVVGDLQPQKQRTLLEGEIIARTASTLRYFAKKHRGMTIDFDGFREIPALYVDPTQIERVFVNLVINAIKYGEKKTRIIVRARKSPRGFHIDVTNQGIGIPSSDVPSVFKPYFRAQNAKDVSQGLGLGLYISKIIMEKHEGRLVLAAHKDPTVFSIFFPSVTSRPIKS